MGCASSKEVRGQQDPCDSDDEAVIAPPGGPPRKSDTTRARRLSYSVEAKSGQAHAEVIVTRASTNSRKDCEEAGSAEPSRHLSPTRSRRLSHVYSEQEQLQSLNSLNADGSQPIKAAWQQPQQQQQLQPQQQQSPQQSKHSSPDRPPLPAAATPPGTSISQSSPKASTVRGVRVSVACMSRAGREPGYHKTNQDNCFAFEKYITEDQALFGAMDGHGPNGHLVSGYVKKSLPMLLVHHITAGLPLREALAVSFQEVDQGLADSDIDCEFSGCTCAVAHLTGRTLTTAWVGDSRMVLGHQKRGWRAGWEAQDVSVDHKPTDVAERQRILGSHGRVERLVDEMGAPIGPYRVWLEYAWLPGLAMSRALGDQLAHTVGVSSQPELMQIELTPADKVLVLASDGVWEFISSKEAIEMVGAAETPEDACRVLVDEAHQRWLNEEEGVVDDITAIVVKLLYDA